MNKAYDMAIKCRDENIELLERNELPFLLISSMEMLFCFRECAVGNWYMSIFYFCLFLLVLLGRLKISRIPEFWEKEAQKCKVEDKKHQRLIDQILSRG